MASKQSSPPGNAAPNSTSKLPKFLQRHGRDRSRSVTESTPIASSSSSGEIAASPSKSRRTSRFLPRRERDDDAAVVVEPIAIPRQANDSPSTRSMGDLQSRLSGWFSHTFNSSSTDLNLSTIMAQPSPKSKASALLTVAKHGKGHLDKAMRYLLDSDATPDKCTDPIWLLGVQHIGYEPPSPTPPPSYTTPRGKRVTSPPSSYRSSTSSIASTTDLSLSISHFPSASQQQQQQQQKTPPGAHWPPVFYIDFVSRIWLTYRSHFSQPIKDSTLTGLCASQPPSAVNDAASTTTTSGSPSKSRWHWGGEKSWSSDTGWGCMLRTGQSLLANALIHVHLGRDWRKPPYPVYTSDYATYVQILTWFFDTPSPDAPFSVHRMALAGKEFGTDVGQWFGPSVAAGAVKRLVNEFPRSGVGVSVAKDGVLSQTDVFLASHADSSTTTRTHSKSTSSTSQALHWGDRPVLILVGLRLGIDGVNPIYYETIKTLFTLPQSVGIAGGRPGSSYYFVGSQADNLFYLDPHHTRPAIPLRSVPTGGMPVGSVLDISSEGSQWQQAREKEMLAVPVEEGLKRDRSWSGGSKLMMRKARQGMSNAASNSPPSSWHPPQHDGASPTSPSPSSGMTSPASTTSQRHAPSSPDNENHVSEIGERRPQQPHRGGPIPISVVLSTSSTTTTNTLPSVQSNSASLASGSAGGKGESLDPVQEHYVTSYSNAELRTFHCDKVRKMPLSGLDPSMLLGFLCKDVREWEELRKGIEDLPRSIFSIQNEHPNWQQEDYDEESLMGLESMSDPEEEVEEDDDDDDDDEEEAGEGGEGEDDLELDMELGEESEVVHQEKKKKKKKGKNEAEHRRTKHEEKNLSNDHDYDSDEVDDDDNDIEYFEPPSSISHSASTSTSTTTTTTTSTTSTNTTTEEEELETEEDPVEALTPGPNNMKFDLGTRGGGVPVGSNDISDSGHHLERGRKKGKQPVGRDEDEEESDIEDGWFGIGDDVDEVEDGVDEDEDDEDEDGDDDVERMLRRRRRDGQGYGETPLTGSEMTIGAGVGGRMSLESRVVPPQTVVTPPPLPPSTTNLETKDKSSSSTSKSKSKSKPTPIPTSSSSSSPPPVSKSKSSSSHTKAKSDPEYRSQKRKKEKKKAVPVPVVTLPVSRSRSATTTAATATYPFPGSGSDGDFEDGMVEVVDGNGYLNQQQQQEGQVWRENGSGNGPGTRSWERGRYESQSWNGVGTSNNVTSGSTGGGVTSGSASTDASNAAAMGGLRMFKGKGRDGGRTQSGGVKGILTDRS
ncbi:hypothetical protein Agabi119p4_11002 [Agaricus bisporus var. burnettii]|uniref:Autophagy-related protein 4 n=1 Tax=Agaricus bisporus var. burnettii TaxID=192524 RepID=A0A8H7C1L2_AGABI|nr:hypothetical protein Agabi119p4_11002 [Agaricus bisporus var. burnettii]